METPNPSQPSPYLSFYGLAREPFAAEIEFDLFYPEPARKQRLDILLHLTQYSDELLLVIGPEGSGKSTLLQQYTARALDTWRVARVEAQSGIDERQLVQQFYHQLELNFQGATHSELLEHLQHHLDALLHNARQGVLLVDDAHRLPVTALRRVLELATRRSFIDKPLLRVILFGEATLVDKLNDPLLGQYADAPRRVIDLPPFDEEHSADYLLHRLSCARFVASEPFSEAALRRLYRQSGGWPGRLNGLAHKLLLDSLPKTEDQPDLPHISNKDLYRPGRLVAVGALIVILVIVVFQTTNNDLFATNPTASAPSEHTTTENPQPRSLQPLAIPAPPETRALKDDSDTRPVADGNEANPPEETLIAPIAKGAQDAQPATATPAPRYSPHPLGGGKATPSPETPAAKPVPPEAAPPPKPAAVVQAPPPQPRPEPLPDWLPRHRNDWLLARNPDRYTLQLVAAKHLETLHQFIIENKLGAKLAFYQSTRKGEPWYVLVYGDYADKQAAIDARSRLPKRLRRLQPWLRPFGSIQKDLRQSRQ